MIKLTVLYPNGAGATFDVAYYGGKHQNLVNKRCGKAIKQVVIEKGLGGAAPGSPPPYIAIGNFWFDSMEAFQNSFAPHIPEFVADIPNFTNTVPVVQLSEVTK